LSDKGSPWIEALPLVIAVIVAVNPGVKRKFHNITELSEFLQSDPWSASAGRGAYDRRELFLSRAFFKQLFTDSQGSLRASVRDRVGKRIVPRLLAAIKDRNVSFETDNPKALVRTEDDKKFYNYMIFLEEAEIEERELTEALA
jgi:hypothetical protein